MQTSINYVLLRTPILNSRRQDQAKKKKHFFFKKKGGKANGLPKLSFCHSHWGSAERNLRMRNRREEGSADGVAYVGDLNVLATLIVAAHLKHQGPHVLAQLSFGHTAHDFCHSGVREKRVREIENRGGRTNG